MSRRGVVDSKGRQFAEVTGASPSGLSGGRGTGTWSSPPRWHSEPLVSRIDADVGQRPADGQGEKLMPASHSTGRARADDGGQGRTGEMLWADKWAGLEVSNSRSDDSTTTRAQES